MNFIFDYIYEREKVFPKVKIEANDKKKNKKKEKIKYYNLIMSKLNKIK